jgi:hypothetical protein
MICCWVIYSELSVIYMYSQLIYYLLGGSIWISLLFFVSPLFFLSLLYFCPPLPFCNRFGCLYFLFSSFLLFLFTSLFIFVPIIALNCLSYLVNKVTLPMALRCPLGCLEPLHETFYSKFDCSVFLLYGI